MLSLAAGRVLSPSPGVSCGSAPGSMGRYGCSHWGFRPVHKKLRVSMSSAPGRVCVGGIRSQRTSWAVGAEVGGFTGRCGSGSESRGRRVCVAGGIRPHRGWGPRLDGRTLGDRGRRSAGGAAAHRRQEVDNSPRLSSDAAGMEAESVLRTVVTETAIPLALPGCPSLSPHPPSCGFTPVAMCRPCV